MIKKRKLRQELSKFARKTEKPPEIISGALGIYIGGKQYVDIPTRPGYVFVRLRNNMSELIQAHNQTVSPIYDLPVLVVWNHNRYEIYGRDSEQYGSYWETSSSFLPKHGFQHEFDPDNNGGGDLVFVHGEQFYPMMTFPSGTDGANTVLIAPYRYFYQGLWRYTGNTGVGDLLALGPTGANNAKLLLVGVTSATGNPFIKQGDEFSEGITGAAALTQFVPTSLTPIDEIPGAIIRLVTGTETITWANIYDARQYMGILQASTGTGGGGGGTIGVYGQDEAVNLGTGTVFNVTGDNISLSISGTVLTLAHTNPTGTPHSFLDLTDTPDSYSGQGGKYVTVNSGATALEFVSASPGGGSGSGLVIYDDSVYKVTGSAISFDAGLDVVVTGSTAFVSIAGGGAALLATSSPSGTNTVTFSGISALYNHLELVYVARSTRAASVFDTLTLKLNNDGTAANYRRTHLFGYAASTVGAAGADNGILGYCPAASSPANSAAAGTARIPFYSQSTFNKQIQAQWSDREDTSSTQIQTYDVGIEWENNAAINQIDIVLLTGTFVFGSKFYLYGIT